MKTDRKLAQGLVYLKVGLSWIMSKKCIRVHVSSKPTRLEPIVRWPTWPSPTLIAWKRIAQHFYFESFPISNQTKWRRLRYMKPLISPKSNQLRFYMFPLKGFQKTVVLIWIWYQAIFFRGKSVDASQTKREEGAADRRLNQNLPRLRWSRRESM